MLSYCSYQGCTSKNLPCSKITFFALPRDTRRGIWIENSGNPLLKNIKPNSVRCFCEKHFDPLALRKQFTRTILRKTAVPYKYSEIIPENVAPIKTTAEEQITEHPVEETLWKYDPTEICTNQSPEVLQPEYAPIEFEDTAENTEYLEIEYEQADYIPTPTEDEINIEQIDTDVEYITHFEPDANNCEPEEIEILLESNDEPGNKDSSGLEPQPIQHVENVRGTVNSINDKNFTSIDLEYENDKHFALSLIGYFQRLPDQRKAFAKLKILQYLTALEYNELETL